MKTVMGFTHVLFLLFLLFACIISHAEKRYVTSMIYSGGSVYYDVNQRGEVAFIGMDDLGKHQVYLYAENTLVQITQSLSYSYSYNAIDINDRGLIVWTMNSAEGGSTAKNMIMLWNGKEIVKIQDQIYWNQVVSPIINNDTVIVWHAAPGYGVHPEIFAYSKGSVRNISDSWYNPDSNPQINQNGWIVWHGDNRNQNQWYNRIRYFNPAASVVNEIPDEGASYAKIGSDNRIIFQKAISGGGYSRLQLFNGSGISEIDDSVHTEGSASYDICDKWVVYSRLNRHNTYDIVRYDGNNYHLISSPGTQNYHAKINKNGVVVWSNDQSEILVRADEAIFNVGVGHFGAHPLINDTGLLVWAGSAIGYYGHKMYISEYKEVFDISGKVILQNGDPLPGAGILLNGTVAAVTDDQGLFSILNVDPGNLTLSFLKSGYQFSPSSVIHNLTGHWQIDPDIVASISTYSGSTDAEAGITVFPNPASDKIRIFCNHALQEDYLLSLYRMDGMVHCSQKISGQALQNGVEVQLMSLPSGTYFLQLNSARKEVNRKVVILR